MFGESAWPTLTPTARELVAGACQAWLADPDNLAEMVDQAVLGPSEELSEDPSVSDLVRDAIRGLIEHWATSNATRPGEPVPPLLSAVTLDIARDAMRRGMLENTANTYRRGVAAAWTYVMDLAFAVIDDKALLREVLDWAARSIFTFVDDTIRGIEQHLEDERRDLVSGSAAERLKSVQALLDGVPMSASDARMRLRYDIAGTHTAAIMWVDDATTELERSAAAVATAAGVTGHLAVSATVRSMWLWFPVEAHRLESAWSAVSAGVRIAVGTTCEGVDGFQQSHREAATARDLGGDTAPVVHFEQVQVVALAGGDPQQADAFVDRVLGGLATADPELRETVRAFLAEGSNLAATARSLHIHRNTAAYRLDAAKTMLPGDLERQRLDIALALELRHWRGA